MPQINLIIQPDGRVTIPKDIILGTDNSIIWSRQTSNQQFSLSITNNPAVLGRVFISHLNPNSGLQEITTMIDQTFTGQTPATIFTAALQQVGGQTTISNTDTDVVIRR